MALIMGYVFLGLALAFVLFIAFLLIRAFTFNPKNTVKVQESEEIFNKDVPFVQTEVEEKCAYCDFKAICKK